MAHKKLENDEETRVRIKGLANIHMSNKQIYEYLEVSRETWCKFKRENPDISDIIKKGRADTTGKVLSVLMEKIFVEQDTASIIFYLKTQAGWGEKKKLEIKNNDAIKKITTEELPKDPVQAARFYQKIME